MECSLDGVRRVVGRGPKLSGYCRQASEPDDSWDGPDRLLNPPVHDEGVELVCERPRLAVFAIVRDFPLQRRLALRVLLPQFDTDGPLLGEPVNGIAG